MDAIADRLGKGEDELLRLGSGFGAGMGTMDGTCGALVGAIMVSSLVSPDGAAMKNSRAIMPRFKELCGGATIPDENVYPVVLSEAEVEDAIRNGTIFDSKTLSAWLCWKIAK